MAVAVFAVVLLSASSAGAVAGYGDVDTGYYVDPVRWSVDHGIAGVVGSCFLPDQPVTRGETAVWMWNMEGRPSAPAHSFVDVPVAESAAVAWMADRDITTGTSDTTFSPDGLLTRGQIAAFLWRLEGEPSAPTHSFSDVTSGWQQQPVAWLSHNKITTGTSPTTFTPGGQLTRAQLITFLYRYKGEPAAVIADPQTPGETDDNMSACKAPLGPFKTVSTGYGPSCAIRTDDTLTCWYNIANLYDGGDPVEPPSGSFKTVAVFDWFSCAISTDDALVCWGDIEEATDTPSGRFKAISREGCALRTDDTEVCWYSEPEAG